MAITINKWNSKKENEIDVLKKLSIEEISYIDKFKPIGYRPDLKFEKRYDDLILKEQILSYFQNLETILINHPGTDGKVIFLKIILKNNTEYILWIRYNISNHNDFIHIIKGNYVIGNFKTKKILQFLITFFNKY